MAGMRLGNAPVGPRQAKLEYKGYMGGKTTVDWTTRSGQDFKGLLLGVLSRAEGRQLCYSSVPQNRKTPLLEEIFPLCLFVIWCQFLEQEFT